MISLCIVACLSNPIKGLIEGYVNIVYGVQAREATLTYQLTAYMYVGFQ